MRLQRTVTVHKPLNKVLADLSDFNTTTEWDPGAVKDRPDIRRWGVRDRVPAGITARGRGR